MSTVARIDNREPRFLSLEIGNNRPPLRIRTAAIADGLISSCLGTCRQKLSASKHFDRGSPACALRSHHRLLQGQSVPCRVGEIINSSNPACTDGLLRRGRSGRFCPKRSKSVVDAFAGTLAISDSDLDCCRSRKTSPTESPDCQDDREAVGHVPSCRG